MSKFVLIKYSAPGWEQEYSTEEDLRKALYNHICGMCREGEEDFSDPVYEHSEIDHLLSTACGCEFGVELE